MSTYHYDQVYSYESIFKEVKELILPTLIERINPADIEASGLNQIQFSEYIYNLIMALGYNELDVNAAVNDLMPTRNPFIYPGPVETDVVNMAIHLCKVIEDYKHQVWAFQGFHKNTQNLMAHKQVIIEVKKQLLATQFGL